MNTIEDLVIAWRKANIQGDISSTSISELRAHADKLIAALRTAEEARVKAERERMLPTPSPASYVRKQKHGMMGGKRGEMRQ